MANTYTKLDSVTVGGSGAANITFSAISQDYTDLIIKGSARGYGNGSANYALSYLEFNSDSTGANYTAQYIQGSGSGSLGSNSLAQMVDVTSGAGATASTFGSVELYIPNYTSSTIKSYNTHYASESNETQTFTGFVAGYWSGTSAITSIKLFGAGNFLQFSTFTLYGIKKPTQTGTGSKAIGGTVTTSGSYTIHTFTSTGMFTPTASITGADVLIVAGGGGGGGYWGGGGGAGGFQTLTSQSYSSGVGYAAIVGAGGAGGITAAGNMGCNSSFSSTVSTGGGYGGYGGNGGAGGSGGGGGYSYGGGAGTSGQGNAGGNGTSGVGYNTGGGGGAGAAGANANGSGVSGSGGAGSSNSYSGSAITYAGGGGGGGRTINGNTSGYGGAGGGGAGGSAGGTTTPASNGQPGTANSGGGGGGSLSSGSAGDSTGGAGGSGIVIVRYLT